MNKTAIIIASLSLTCFSLCALVLGQSQCDIICNEEENIGQKVCGSDGVTYGSKCEFNNAACRAAKNGTKLGLLYEGDCITMTTPCNIVVNHNCPTRYYHSSYLCGTDGNTYRSECILAQAHCKSLQDPNHPVINLDHNGPCEHLTNESRIVDCGQFLPHSSGAIAIEGGASAQLHLEVCTREYNPVCSLEGRTYSNDCSFCHSLAIKHMITRSNMTVYIAHDGYCHHGMIIG